LAQLVPYSTLFPIMLVLQWGWRTRLLVFSDFDAIELFSPFFEPSFILPSHRFHFLVHCFEAYALPFRPATWASDCLIDSELFEQSIRETEA